MLHHDLVALDEIQSITFTDTMEMRSILKNYLEYGKTNVDNYEFMSECGLILLGNIPLSEDGFPMSDNYVEELPEAFKESALLDRFHGFIEGWLLPRITNDMALDLERRIFLGGLTSTQNRNGVCYNCKSIYRSSGGCRYAPSESRKAYCFSLSEATVSTHSQKGGYGYC